MDESSIAIKKIAILGGTGKEGKGLAYRWAKAGLEVVIGSRTQEKAQAAANELNGKLKENGETVKGMENKNAADWSDLVVLTVPYSAQMNMLQAVKESVLGKILINVTVPLAPPKVTKVQMPPAGSTRLSRRTNCGSSCISECILRTAFQR